jgi:pimeloyl-ACP methyl ester carboxylesterase
MTDFVLVHGAWHGGWCWEHLVPELERDGHRAVVVDLPCDDPAAAFEDYAEAVLAAMQGLGEPPVLVGHSLAGLTVPLVAARTPVRHVVYVCSLLPTPGKPFLERLRREPDMLAPSYRSGLEAVDECGTTRWVDEDLAREHLYDDCDAALSRAAFSQLRPQATTAYRRPCRLDGMPEVPSTYVVCQQDRLVSPAWSRRAAAGIDASVVELPGGHSPFLSRPRELAAVLSRL